MEHTALKELLNMQLQTSFSFSTYLKKLVIQSQPVGYYLMLLAGEFNLKESDLIV
jgi:hypothetical protein